MEAQKFVGFEADVLETQLERGKMCKVAGVPKKFKRHRMYSPCYQQSTRIF